MTDNRTALIALVFAFIGLPMAIAAFTVSPLGVAMQEATTAAHAQAERLFDPIAD